MPILLLILTAISFVLVRAVGKNASSTAQWPRWNSALANISQTMLYCQIGALVVGTFLRLWQPGWLLHGILAWGFRHAAYALVGVAFLRGLLAPRRNSDGKFSPLLALVLAGGLQCLILLASLALLSLPPSGEQVITAATSDRMKLAPYAYAKYLADRLIPDGARDITLYFIAGDWLGGGSAELRCNCTPEELQAFAAKNDYAFQADSITLNANPATSASWNDDRIAETWRRFHPQENQLEPPQYPQNFLAYNFIYGNGGGHSFLYDVETQTLYAFYAHN